MKGEEERPDERSEGADRPDSRAEIVQKLGPYLGLGWVLAAAVLAGTAGGYYADKWLGTSPWLTLAGILLGMTAGFTSVLRTLFSTPSDKR